MKLKELKKELSKMKGLDNWDVHILIEELPDKLHTTDCTRIGVCIDDHVIVLGFGNCPNCED